jgi:outer membrane protein assembly factor BamB/tetratricopeptide (TPR) repeat protein
VRIVILVSLLLGGVAAAQDHNVGQPFWVSTPAPAREALRTAAQAAAENQPTRAAQALQLVFDKYSNAFVAQSGARGGYVGARQRGIEMLGALGANVRNTYERLYGGTAEEMLRQALALGNRRALRDVIRRFEGTQAGLGAVIALADRAMQRGHPAEARLLLARIPQLHPDAIDRMPGLRARIERAARLDHETGGPPAASSEDADTARDSESRRTGARDWPMVGGNATRTRVAGAIRQRAGDRVADPEPEPAYDFDVVGINERFSDEPIQPDRGFGSARGQQAAREWRRAWHEFLPLAPSISRGRLVVLDGKQVVARNLYSGEEIWRWPADPFSANKGRTNISQILSPTIVDGTVYATVEVKVPWRAQHLQTVPITYYLPQRRLVALDLETGSVRWTHRGRELQRNAEKNERDAEPMLSKLTIVGVPLVRGDRIYAPAAYTEGTIHTHLMAVDRHTGELIYVTRISNGQQELNLFGRQLNELVTTPVAEADGQIIFGTNLGIVCSVDAVLGSPLWARPYNIVRIPSTYLWFEAPRRWPLLDNGAPLILGDLVVVSPSDGRGVLAIHRRSGRIVWEFAARHNPLGFPVRRIHGSDGERLFLGGDDGVVALWLKSDAAGTRVGGHRAWVHEFGADEQGAGRGVLARDGLWIPTYRSVLHLDPDTGVEREGSFVREGVDSDERVQLVAAEGALVATGRDVVTVRYEEDDVVRVAQEAIRRAPQKAEPRLAAGDIHLAVGSYEKAAKSYREALERASRDGAAPLVRRARSGLHHALLRNAFRFLEHEMQRSRAAFDLAFRAAPSPERAFEARRALEMRLAAARRNDDADWRLQNLRRIEKDFGQRSLDESGRTVRGWALRRMAAIHVLLGDPRRAVADLQKLLERDPGGPDAAIASSAIGRILRETGRKVYEPYERRARNLFTATLKSGNLDALERGLHIYANAAAAADATLQLAERRLKAGESAHAAAVLQRFLVDRPGAKQIPRALRLLFEAFHSRKAYGPAFAALQRLRRSHPQARIVRADGAAIPAIAWTDTWLAREPYAMLRRSAHRRDLEPPLAMRFEKSFDGHFVDVPELLGQQHPALRHAVIVRLGDHAAALDTRTGRELYRLKFGRQTPLGAFVLAGGRLIAVTASRVHVFDAASGALLARQPIPAGDEGIRLLEHRGQVFLLSRARRRRGTLRVTSLDSERATPLWSSSIPVLSSGERLSERHVVAQADRLVLFSSGAAHITVLDTSSGAIENRIPVLESGNAYLPSTPQALADGRILAGYVPSRGSRRARSSEQTFMLVLLDPARDGNEAIAWRYRPKPEVRGRRLAHLQVIGDYVVTLESSGARLVSLLRLRDGHLIRQRSLNEITRMRISLADSQPRNDSLLLVLSDGDDREDEPPRLFGIEPADLSLRYTLELAQDGSVQPRVVRSDGVTTISIEPARLRKGGLSFQLIDPINARRVQQITPKVGRGSWFTAKVQNGAPLG